MDKISVATFLEGFHKLVGQSPPPIWLQTDNSVQVTESPPSHTLNTNISLAKLFQVLKKLQKNKAIGLDGMKIEFILDAKELLHMPLLIAFKCFLEVISTKMVHAFFKGGDASEFVDFKKTFDSLPREVLWQVLVGLKVGGCFL
jgi:hypothetical protein